MIGGGGRRSLPISPSLDVPVGLCVRSIKVDRVPAGVGILGDPVIARVRLGQLRLVDQVGVFRTNIGPSRLER